MRQLLAGLGMSCTILLSQTALLPQAAVAEPVPAATAYITPDMVAEIRDVLDNEIVALLVNAQNERHAEMSQADIDAIDQTWRAEREAAVKPLITATLTNPLST